MSEMSFANARRACVMVTVATVGLIATISGHACADFSPFTEESVARGIGYTPAVYYEGLGSAFADLDNDGDADLITLGRAGGLIGLWENDGNGYFTDRQPGSGMTAAFFASGVCAGDYDRDGDLDVFITIVGTANRLYRNDGNFQFTNVAVAAGVADAGIDVGGSWGDYNNDGWLDLNMWVYGSPNKLYENQGDGTFVDVAGALGVDDTDDDPTLQISFVDFDQDGDADLYVANDKGDCIPNHWYNHLFENNGDGTFTDITFASGTEACIESMCIAIGDFDLNGFQDFYVTNTAAGGNVLLWNTGTGTFVDGTTEAGVSSDRLGWGSHFFDFDHDGWLDLFVCNVDNANRFYRHEGTLPCDDIAADLGVDFNGKSFTVATADIDNDGDLDMIVEGHNQPIKLYINQEGQKRSWARFDVVGEGPMHYAIGAQVTVTTGGVDRMSEVIAGSNYKSQNELVLHYGLGTATTLDTVSILWPGGTTRVITNLDANTRWRLYPPDKLGDGDQDGDRDLDDFFAFQNCFTGDSPGALQPGCEMMDLDGDADVDNDDFALFLADYDDPIEDCNKNKIPDLQEILDGAADADMNGVPDSCEGGSSCPDFNSDGMVNLFELLDLLDAWGPNLGHPADLTGDGFVNLFDLLELLDQWGPC